MEMLVKNIVMSGCCCGCKGKASESTVEVQPAVSESLNNEIIEAIGLARAYIPSQPYTQPLGDMEALGFGTVFGDMVMPYVKGSALARYDEEECGNE